MRHIRRFAVPLFVVAVVLAGCSGGSGKGLQINDSGTNTTVARSDSGPNDTGSTDTGSTDTGSAAHVPTKSELESALLTTDDLPDGFEKDTSGDDDDDAGDIHADDAHCDAALNAIDDDSDGADVEADFTDEPTEFVTHELVAAPDADKELAESISTIKDACGSKFSVHGEALKSGTFELLGDPGVGDHAALIRMKFAGETEGTEFTAEGYLVLVQRGPVGSTISAFSISVPDAGVKGNPPTEDDALSLARSADDHVKDLVG